MASIPPPQGMSEIDYEAIEAAVTETVRGRWFLSEYARRNRLAETRQLLDAMARIEAAVTAGPAALPSADPSIRLLIQRVKDIAGQLGTVSAEMRAAGVEDQLVEAVDIQARAVAGMMRNGPVDGAPARADLSRAESPRLENARLDDTRRAPKAEIPAPPVPSMPRMPRAEPLATPRQQPPADPEASTIPRSGAGDPRLSALAEIDSMTLARKLALFT